MALRKPDWDEELRRRAKTEDCPIPQDFEKRLEARLTKLPQGAGRPRRRLKSALVLAAGLLLLTLSADLPIPIWLYFYPRAGCCFLWWFTCAVEYGSDPRRRKKEASP